MKHKTAKAINQPQQGDYEEYPSYLFDKKAYEELRKAIKTYNKKQAKLNIQERGKAMKHTITVSDCCGAEVYISTQNCRCKKCYKPCGIETIPVTPDEEIAKVLRMEIIRSGASSISIVKETVKKIINSIAKELNINLNDNK